MIITVYCNIIPGVTEKIKNVIYAYNPRFFIGARKFSKKKKNQSYPK